MIGALTAMIGDLASHFGCTIGLKDAVTALAFVALGTSVPGKFSLFTISHTNMDYQIQEKTVLYFNWYLTIQSKYFLRKRTRLDF
jgi:hypothetical protein